MSGLSMARAVMPMAVLMGSGREEAWLSQVTVPTGGKSEGHPRVSRTAAFTS